MFIEEKTLKKISDRTKAVEIAQNTNIKGARHLQQSLVKELALQTKFGEDKHKAKAQAIEAHKAECERKGEPYRIVNVKLEGIYSHSTFENYLKVGGRFLDYMDKNDLQARNVIDAIRKYGVDYLKSLEDRGLSVYTIGQAKAFMTKVTGKEVDYKTDPQHAQDITKGRDVSKRFALFSEDKNRSLVTIARATGGRRSDLEKLEVKDFIREKGIIVGVEFNNSKGGRDRYSPILPEYQKEVTKIVNEWERTGQTKAFDKVNSMMNVHAYRREYCRELYNYCSNNKDYREQLLKTYKTYDHEMTRKDKKIDTYKTNDGREFSRASLFISSQALGHNRLDIIPRNYFK